MTTEMIFIIIGFIMFIAGLLLTKKDAGFLMMALFGCIIAGSAFVVSTFSQCPECGRRQTQHSYCIECGSEMPSEIEIYCFVCNKRIDETNAVFCPDCGTALVEKTKQ